MRILRFLHFIQVIDAHFLVLEDVQRYIQLLDRLIDPDLLLYGLLILSSGAFLCLSGLPLRVKPVWVFDSIRLGTCINHTCFRGERSQ